MFELIPLVTLNWPLEDLEPQVVEHQLDFHLLFPLARVRVSVTGYRFKCALEPTQLHL